MTLSSDLRRIADQIDWEVACGETAFVSEYAAHTKDPA